MQKQSRLQLAPFAAAAEVSIKEQAFVCITATASSFLPWSSTSASSSSSSSSTSSGCRRFLCLHGHHDHLRLRLYHHRHQPHIMMMIIIIVIVTTITMAIITIHPLCDFEDVPRKAYEDRFFRLPRASVSDNDVNDDIYSNARWTGVHTAF